MASSSSSKYPYPATINVANFVSLKLTSTNYLLWETQVLALIESQDLLGFITVKVPEPEAEIDGEGGKVPNPDQAAWKWTDRLVKAWITATMSEEALGTVVGLTNSFEVWTALTNAYSQDSQAREFELNLKLQEKRKESTSFIDYIREFKLTCDQLNAIDRLHPVLSYNDLIPLLHSHELHNKSQLSEHANPTLAFVEQRSTSHNQMKRGYILLLPQEEEVLLSPTKGLRITNLILSPACRQQILHNQTVSSLLLNVRFAIREVTILSIVGIGSITVIKLIKFLKLWLRFISIHLRTMNGFQILVQQHILLMI
ncbi:hypothetical protein Q3G72_011735 [Acer saccharum]|nr:hypothetical protein Q3G72_011735 [Acer saccharum]